MLLGLDFPGKIKDRLVDADETQGQAGQGQHKGAHGKRAPPAQGYGASKHLSNAAEGKEGKEWGKPPRNSPRREPRKLGVSKVPVHPGKASPGEGESEETRDQDVDGGGSYPIEDCERFRSG